MAFDLTITYDPDAKGISGDNWPFVPCYHVARGPSHLATVSATMTREARLEALHRLGLGRGQGEDEPLRDAFLRWTLRRLERELGDQNSAALLFEQNGAAWTISSADEEDIAAIVAEAGPKECGYQLRNGRDLFCSTPSPRDETAVLAINGTRVAPTSRPICAECNLPSTVWLCSHFLHPAVIGTGAKNSHSRQVASAMCDLGHDDLLRQDPSSCRTGRDCWQRTVSTGEKASGPALSPLSLPEALDFLDAVWQLAHGSKHLLGQVATAHAPGLALPAATRDDFKSRVNDLTDTLDNLKVPAVQPSDGSSAPPREATLSRLKAYFEVELGADEAAVARTSHAVETLKRITEIRNALQHSGAASKLPAAFAALDIAYPPQWPGAWDDVRARAVEALIVLRDELRRHSP